MNDYVNYHPKKLTLLPANPETLHVFYSSLNPLFLLKCNYYPNIYGNDGLFFIFYFCFSYSFITHVQF